MTPTPPRSWTSPVPITLPDGTYGWVWAEPMMTTDSFHRAELRVVVQLPPLDDPRPRGGIGAFFARLYTWFVTQRD